MTTEINELDLPAIEDSPVSPATALASVSLSLALRWFDITVVKDGTMYQQLKMEQKVIEPIGLPELFDVAKQFEQHLATAPGRLSSMIIDAVKTGIEMDYPSHPGEVFKEHLSENIVTATDEAIADVLDISVIELRKFFAGQVDVTLELAKKIERYYDYPATTLMELQRNYDEAKERRSNAGDQTSVG